MKKSIIFSLIICSSLLSYGQLSIGLSAGSNLSSMSIYLRDRSTFRINPTIGYNVNIIAEYKFNPNISLWSGLSVTQKGFNQHIKYFYMPGLDTTANITSKLNYLELPLYLKFTTNLNQIDLFYGFGSQISYGIQGKITTEINGRSDLTISEKMKWDKVYDYSDLVNYYAYANLKRFDFGVGTMFGMEYKNFMVIASYRYGLRNIMWEYYQDEKMSNSSLSISVGYSFSGLFAPKQKEIK